MAAPNLLNAATINGKSATLALTTSNQSLLSNAASSGKVLKVNSLYIANIDGTNTQTFTLTYHSAAAIGGSSTALSSTISVPANSTLVFITKDAPLYLEEDRSLGALAGANSDLVAVISYEDIS